MPVYRMQVSWGADGGLPRDRFVITPHFSDAGSVANDPQGLCDDLADALVGWRGTFSGVSREVLVKAYDAEHVSTAQDPGVPLGEAIREPNAFPQSATPRELAVCLSFYSERNLPRRRGRLYVPGPFVFGSGVSVARPSDAHRAIVAGLVPIFTGLGGADVDWVVWSRRDRVARPVTHWYVDDEFDVQRRRGLRSTTRTVGTTEEAGLPG